MIRPIHDRIAAEVLAAENRRRGAPIAREYTDPRRHEIRRKLEEIEDVRRMKEATEWL